MKTNESKTIIGPCAAGKPLQLSPVFINYQRHVRSWDSDCLVVLSYCLVVLSCCLVRVSKGEQRRLTDSKCYIFSKSSQQLGFR